MTTSPTPSPTNDHTKPDAAVRGRSPRAGDDDRPRWVAVLGVRAKIRVIGGRDARVAAIVDQQRGRASRRQLLDAGLSGDQIDWLIRRERLFREHPGVYATHRGPTELGRETSALLAAGPGALLSHCSAATLWDLEVAVPDDATVDVLVDASRRVRRRGIRAHRTRHFAAVEARVRHRLPVCSPAQIVLDLALELDDRALIALHDQALVRRLAAPRDLAAVLDAQPTHPGAPALRALLADHDGYGPTRSVAEQELLGLFREAGLPRPLVNHRIAGLEVDLLWPRSRLVVEMDGFGFHFTPARQDRGHARERRLRDHGLEVLHVTPRRLRREPTAIVAEVAAALAVRTSAE